MSRSKSQNTKPKRRVPPQGTIELCRSAEGNMYFHARIGDDHRTWRVHPEGEKWLAGWGYTVGMKIKGSTASYMRKLDLVYTLKPAVKKPGTHGDPTKQLSRNTKEFEKRWAKDNERYPALIEEMQSRKKGSQG